MSLVIRFSKLGRKGERKLKLVVAEKRSKRDGEPVEVLGYYEKKIGGQVIKTINLDLVNSWVKKGAQLSESAKKVLSI